MNKLYRYFTSLLFSLGALSGIAQTINTPVVQDQAIKDGFFNFLYPKSFSFDVNPDTLKSSSIYVGGTSRVFAYNGRMQDAFPGSVYPKVKTVYREFFNRPFLNMFLSTSNDKVLKFATNIRFFNEFRGLNDFAGQDDKKSNNYDIAFGVNIFGEAKTNFGLFQMTGGGIQWNSISTFTMGGGGNIGINRENYFDYMDEEGEANMMNKYQNFFNTPQGSNLYNGSRAFQGVNISGSELPLGISFKLMYGKTDILNGGFNSNQRPTTPSEMLGFKIKKDFKTFTIAVNTLNSYVTKQAKNSLPNGTDIFGSTNNQNFAIHTLEFNKKFENFVLNTEMGAGNYLSKDFASGTRAWSEGLLAHIKTTKNLTGIPIDIVLYQLGKNFLNPNGSFANSSMPVDYIQTRTSYSAASFTLTKSPVNTLISSNRRGANINFFHNVGKFKLNIGYGIASDISKSDNKLAFFHTINGFAFARFFGGNTGPYSRITSFFQTYFDNIDTKDVESDGKTSKNIRGYNSIDFQLKYASPIGSNKHIYVFYNAGMTSAQPGASLLPVLDDKSYVRGINNEVDVYFKFHKRIMLCLTGGYEIGKASAVLTNVDIKTGKPRDQVAYTFGTGFDFDLGNSIHLALRNRFFDYKDKSFEDEKFKGFETTADLKMSFW